MFLDSSYRANWRPAHPHTAGFSRCASRHHLGAERPVPPALDRQRYWPRINVVATAFGS